VAISSSAISPSLTCLWASRLDRPAPVIGGVPALGWDTIGFGGVADVFPLRGTRAVISLAVATMATTQVCARVALLEATGQFGRATVGWRLVAAAKPSASVAAYADLGMASIGCAVGHRAMEAEAWMGS
jgi:hypothetical protein